MNAIALIVEDRPEIVTIWTRALIKLQMEIKVAHTLADAKRITKEIPPPDLIILDLGLPDSTAKNTAESVNELTQGNPNTVVLVISGLLTPDLEALVYERGADNAIEKLCVEQQKDLWEGIAKAQEIATQKGKSALKSTSELIKKLTSALHFL
jgi:DNA-binding response OmpR family regulator